jgi:ring-1,2-phenylacetyl-CoA epoxidase subunit PaaB
MNKTSGHLPLWEVFIRSKRGLDHKHVGSLHAADAEQAMQYARDTYTRRNEGCSIWIVRSTDIHASQAEDSSSFFDPADDKVYRHPTFYDIPEHLKI